jgi:hypothetical protein
MRPVLALLAALAAVPLIGARRAAQPVVLELLQPGLLLCPPAEEIAVGKESLPGRRHRAQLQRPYWDHLGWKDTFARPEFTERQKAYARALGQGALYAGSGGRRPAPGGVGNTPRGVDEADRKGPHPSHRHHHRRARQGERQRRRRARHEADVWLVSYDPRVIQVPVKAGENTGKTLPSGTWCGR